MKRYPPIVARPPRHVRVPAFSPVPLRGRGDGWTPLRQAAFLGALAETGSVVAAARKVAMARETAYRLRRRAGAESFAAAWDKVTGRVTAPPAKVTSDARMQRALYGLLKPVMYGGRHVGTVRKADNSALLGHLAQLDRGLAEGHMGPGRSQSFALPPRSTFGAGFAPPTGENLRGKPRDTPGRSRTGEPFPACRDAGPTRGTRR
jgi:hypothetical protein